MKKGKLQIDDRVVTPKTVEVAPCCVYVRKDLPQTQETNPGCMDDATSRDAQRKPRYVRMHGLKRR